MLDELLREDEARVAAVDHDQTRIAREAFLRYGKGRHPAGLNVGDLFAYALARQRDRPLLFTGDDFRHTDVRAAWSP